MGKEVLSKLVTETESGKPPILLGKELANTLGVMEGDQVSLVSPFGKMGPFGATAKVKKFEVVGVFDYGMIEYDSSISYVDLKDAMDFFDMSGEVSGGRSRSGYLRCEAHERGACLNSGLPYYTRNWEEVKSFSKPSGWRG
jgi:lipoprotein-releasing system permease protein